MLATTPGTAPITLRDLGIDIRPSESQLADFQSARAISLTRDVLHLIENDASLMAYELGILEQQGRAGKRLAARHLQRQDTYVKNLRRILKVLESAQARREQAD